MEVSSLTGLAQSGQLRDELFMRTRYGYAISDDQIDELLNVEKNSGSVGYWRFMRNAK